jgi:xanthine dehydrogenase YagR molybdenum-binding subunit
MSIGQPVARVEARAKVTGAARYAADVRLPGLLHAVIVGAPVAAGRLRHIDATAALALPGVVRVLTRADLPRFGAVGMPAAVLKLPMQDDQIRHEGEPVALVLAESVDAAEAGRAAVRVEVEAAVPRVVGQGPRETPEGPQMLGTSEDRGDVAAGLAAAAVRLEQSYEQAPRHHNAMETSATVARFEDGELTLWDAVQAAENVQQVLAAALGLEREHIRVIAPHTGGGFGAKGYVWPHQILAAAAARAVGRPVKLQLRRSDQFACVGYQPWMRQDIRLGAERDGRLTALSHEATNATALFDTHLEPATEAAKSVYACPALHTRQHLERVHANVPTPMRSPVEGPGLWALESALNELADLLGLDPLDLRLANHADVDPATGKPWSSKKLRECYAEGARRFGWRERASLPRTDGPWRLGRGMATCSMGCFRFPGAARVRLLADVDGGRAVIETNTHDIGTGGLTVFSQIASEVLGLPLERIDIAWGDTRLPRTGPVYGSSSTMGTGSAVLVACRQLRDRLAREGGAIEAGRLRLPEGVQAMAEEGVFKLPGDALFEGDGAGTGWAMRTFGAVFVEVAVDPSLGLLRLRRAVGAYSVGRVMNPRTARSQMTGGTIWGWGKATMEQTPAEPVHGRWLAKNLSNLCVPVNADIPADIDICFIEETDPQASLIGARGIGELAATGVDAAVAAAVHDAVGLRLRKVPMRPQDVVEGLSHTERTKFSDT